MSKVPMMFCNLKLMNKCDYLHIFTNKFNQNLEGLKSSYIGVYKEMGKKIQKKEEKKNEFILF